MEDAFDKSVNDAFGGIGQPRSERCGQYRAILERLCAGTRYTIEGVWEENGICASVSFPDGDSTVTGMVLIPNPDPSRMEEQAQSSLQWFMDFVSSPVFKMRGTNTLR